MRKSILFGWLFLGIFCGLTAQKRVSLGEAIRLATDNNLNLKTYQYNADIQKSDIITAGLRPNINFNQQGLFLGSQKYLNNIKPGQVLFLSPYAQQMWFQFTKVFQLSGQRQAKIDYQTRDYEFSKKDVIQFANEVAYQTALKWVDSWYARVKQEIVYEAMENADTLLDINKNRLKNLVITTSELTRIQILYDKYSVMNNAAKQAYRSELIKLRFMLNSKDSLDLVMDENSFFYKNLPPIPDSLLSIALASRPDIKADRAAKEVAAAFNRMQIKLAQPMPEMGFVLNPQNVQPYGGWYFQVPIPVFNRNQGEIQKSRIMTQQAEMQVNTTTEQIRNELQYTLQEFDTYRRNTAEYEEIIKKSDYVLKTVRFAYLRGGTTFLDYLFAQQSWFETQQAYYDAMYAYRRSYVQLLYTTGTLLD